MTICVTFENLDSEKPLSNSLCCGNVNAVDTGNRQFRNYRLNAHFGGIIIATWRS